MDEPPTAPGPPEGRPPESPSAPPDAVTGPPPPAFPPPPSPPQSPSFGLPPPPAGVTGPPSTPPSVLPPPVYPPALPATPRLRALGLAELLDAAFTLYRRNFALLVAIAAVLEIPSAVLQLLLLGGAAGTRPSHLGLYFGVNFALSVAEFLLIRPLVQAAVTRAVSDRYLGRPATVSLSYRYALGRLRSLVAMSLELVLLAIALLVPLAIIAGLSGQAVVLILMMVSAVPLIIYAGVRVSFAAPAIVVEGLSGWSGIKRSWRLTEGSWWRLFGVLLLVGLLVAVISGTTAGFLQLPSLALGTTARIAYSTVISAAVNVFVAPVQLIVITLLYYDLRIRREAFDIETLAASL